MDASSYLPGSPEARKARRLLGQAANLFVMVDLSGSPGLAAVRALLEEAPGLFGGRLPAFSPLPDTAVDLPQQPAAASTRLDWSPLSVPGLHAVLDDTGAMSPPEKKKTEEYNSLLNRLGSAALGSTARDAARGNGQSGQDTADTRRRLHLVAHMLGEVSLSGSMFDVRIHGGRFCGVTRQGRDLMPLQAARAYGPSRDGVS